MLERLIHEIHRRSMWQVLAIFGASGWAVLQVIDALIDNGILPDWVFKAGLVLLLLGLPVVLATAFVQEGLPGPSPEPDTSSSGETSVGDVIAESAPANLATGTGSLDRRSTRAPKHVRLFTWRNALLGGVGAFAQLGVAVAGYFAMRVTGIGPVASLEAQGVFDEREPVVLADFASTAGDSTLGRMVTEALRVDLHESRAVTVLPPTYIAGAIARMERARDEVLTPELAREIAVRDGIKAVVHGSIAAAGGGYVLTASIVRAEDGSVLAAFRETAPSDERLLDTIDRLSKRIREKAGESLRSIKAGEPLSDVTTSSLEALRAYTNAVEAGLRGDEETSVVLLKRAIELDPEFAMAHRRLAVSLSNMRIDPSLVRASATRAWELRHRLSESERLIAEAYYHTRVSGDRDNAIQAYRQLLRQHPDNYIALNNLPILLTRSRAEAEEALELNKRQAEAPGASVTVYNNYVVSLWGLYRDRQADSVAVIAAQKLPSEYYASRLTAYLLYQQRRYGEARAALEEVLEQPGVTSFQALDGSLQLAAIDAGRGMVSEARRHVTDAQRIARDQGRASLNIRALSELALIELFTARSSGRLRSALSEMTRSNETEWSSVDVYVVGTVATVAALAGDTRMQQRARDAFEQLAPPSQREPLHEAMIAWADWAAALARNDAQAALEAALKMERSYWGSCEGRRCLVYFEQGRALDELGRTADAIAAYERHMEGTVLSNSSYDAAVTPLVMERLGELYEQQGNVQKAAEYWARLAEQWKDADAELQPRVQHARHRAAALLAKVG
jgi:eukaryotic-like serine/threonine-protein kinase